MPNAVGQRVFLKLVEKVGLHAVSVGLGVSPTLVERFLTGSVRVPDSLLLRAVDFLAASDGKVMTPPPDGERDVERPDKG